MKQNHQINKRFDNNDVFRISRAAEKRVVNPQQIQERMFSQAQERAWHFEAFFFVCSFFVLLIQIVSHNATAGSVALVSSG